MIHSKGKPAARLGTDGHSVVLFPAFAQTGALLGRLHQPSQRPRPQLHRSRQMAHSRTIPKSMLFISIVYSFIIHLLLLLLLFTMN